jgi:antitoxin component YwqK of YwqJK toxin-antitoxin module
VPAARLPVGSCHFARGRATFLSLPIGNWLLASAFIVLSACSNPDTARIRQTTKPTYDATTGKLIQLTYDRNKNGLIDTWIDMDGTRPIQSRVDLNEDGKIDRWEYYDKDGTLTKVGFSRANTGKPDAWAYAGADGHVARVEISSTSDEHKIDRWEYYDGSLPAPNGDATGALVRAEEDTNADGKIDKWETYDHGQLATVAFDQDYDGKIDRRLTYKDRQLVLIESNPDASGFYRARKPVT